MCIACIIATMFTALTFVRAADRFPYRGPCGASGLLGFYNGAANAAVCCHSSCGLCQNDAACGSRIGGSTNCCPGLIRRRTSACNLAQERSVVAPPCPIRARCHDWRPLQRWRAPYPKRKNLAPSPQKFNVLLFLAVGRSKASIVADTCTKALALNTTIFLAHYDGSLAWYAEHYADWYPQIWRSVNYTDFKANYVRRELVIKRAVEILPFSHVWVLDDDIRFPSLIELASFFTTVASERPLIAQPAIYGSWQTLVAPEQQDKFASACLVWTTDFVEVMAPIMQTPVLIDVYSRLLSTNARSDWGMDMAWCAYARRRFNYNRNKTCIVVGVPFRKGDRITAKPNYFRFYEHSYSTAASLWDKRCMKHNLQPLWATFKGRCLRPMNNRTLLAISRKQPAPHVETSHVQLATSKSSTSFGVEQNSADMHQTQVVTRRRQRTRHHRSSRRPLQMLLAERELDTVARTPKLFAGDENGLPSHTTGVRRPKPLT